MQDEVTGNITLNRADTFTLEFSWENEAGIALPLVAGNTRFHVGTEAQYLFSLTPTADAVDPTVVHFTFTPAHAALLGKKEWDWIIRDEEALDVLAQGATISATGFTVPEVQP